MRSSERKRKNEHGQHDESSSPDDEVRVDVHVTPGTVTASATAAITPDKEGN